MKNRIVLQTCPICLEGPVTERRKSRLLGLFATNRLVCEACGSVLERVRDTYRYSAISPDHPQMRGCSTSVFYSLDDVRELASRRLQHLAAQHAARERLAAQEAAKWAGLLAQARAIVAQQEHASPLLLKRRLGVHYAEASRLMDELEKEGIVGPQEPGREWREVLPCQDRPPAAVTKQLARPGEGGGEPSELTWQEFEECMAELFRALGYRNVRLTPPTGDGGKDIVMEWPDPMGRTRAIYVECKHWKTNSVGRRAVQILHSAVVANPQVHDGIIVTTGTFTDGATTYADQVRVIQLIDGKKLRGLVAAAQAQLSDDAKTKWRRIVGG